MDALDAGLFSASKLKPLLSQWITRFYGHWTLNIDKLLNLLFLFFLLLPLKVTFLASIASKMMSGLLKTLSRFRFWTLDAPIKDYVIPPLFYVDVNV